MWDSFADAALPGSDENLDWVTLYYIGTVILHMPESTLLMMVSAFGGYDLVMKAYKEAIKEKYRFYSYGDVMLII